MNASRPKFDILVKTEHWRLIGILSYGNFSKNHNDTMRHVALSNLVDLDQISHICDPPIFVLHIHSRIQASMCNWNRTRPAYQTDHTKRVNRGEVQRVHPHSRTGRKCSPGKN